MQATVLTDDRNEPAGPAGPPRSRRRRAIRAGAWSAPAVAVAAVAMTLGGAQKASCVPSPQMSCYSDVHSLWSARNLASHVLPYVHGGIVGTHFVGHELEYPVLTGLFVWLCSLPAHSVLTFMLVTMAALAPFGLLTAWMLGRMVGRRALYFSAAPTLVWYAFLNWDLLGVWAAVAAVFAWSRGRFRTAGLLLGIGACFKLWPGYLLLPLAADLLCRRRWRDAVGALVSGGAALLAANVPFMIVNFGGWRAPLVFQALRPADLSANSLWSVVAPSVKSVGTVDHLAAGACGLAFVLVLGAGWLRFRREGSFPFVQASMALVAAFIVFGKVHSPQYALWVLPFFALLRIGRGWWLLFLAGDVWLFAQFAGFSAVHIPLDHSAIVISDVILLAVAWVAMRSETAISGLGPGLPELLG